MQTISFAVLILFEQVGPADITEWCIKRKKIQLEILGILSKGCDQVFRNCVISHQTLAFEAAGSIREWTVIDIEL
jgi:sorbitol-specific phosphotransferase system component IIA